ncbi:MAG: hypothetical protein M1821_009583 [Bathelium mastoideum]|nr:MAG: hypothetical protein M1821_009583 [Bathelium mastoideum]KAI9688807.1 MAG: hypothetical protein M1822_001164 [Bathelium mastoideum]
MPPILPLRTNADAPLSHLSDMVSDLTRRYIIIHTTPPAPQFAYLNSVYALPSYVVTRALQKLHTLTRRLSIPSSPFLSTTYPPTHPLAKRSLLHNPLLQPRQQPEIAIPTIYSGLNAGPTPGAVVGIVLGSVVAFLLVVWLLFFLTQNQRASIEGESVYIESRRRSTSPPPRSRSSRHTRTTRRHTEVREVSRSPRPERVVVEERERIVREPAPPPVVVRETVRAPPVIVSEERHEERRVEGDDIIEVMEEQSDITPEPQPRRKSSANRRSSGYRSVDPNQYGGGEYNQRDVYSRRGSNR